MHTPHFSHLIAEPVTTAGCLTVTNPCDQRPIATVDLVDGAGVDRALAIAAALFHDRRAWLPAHRRAAILARTAELMSERAAELALEAAREGGKPLTDSRVEVARAIDGVRNCAELLRHEGGQEIPMGATAASDGRLAFTTREPIGPVVAISAFNHPLNLAVHQVGPAVAAGAQRLCGGAPLSQTCYPATVLLDPPDSVRVSTQEVFGPVICVYPYDDMAEAIEQANALPFAFQAAVFTRDLGRALHAAQRLAASAVMINDHTAFRVDWMPFAGLRESGLGTGGIRHTFRDMQTEKLLVLRQGSG